jgi:hypothetical protein
MNSFFHVTYNFDYFYFIGITEESRYKILTKNGIEEWFLDSPNITFEERC